MLTSRLRARCKSARLKTVARATGFSVSFSKPSKDKSGKATLSVCNSEANALGVVFEISTDELIELDSVEGDGYERQEQFEVTCLHSGEIIQTYTYLAKKEDSNLKPYDWYLSLVIAGIIEHNLDCNYVSAIRGVGFDVDVDKSRKSRLEAVKALQIVGISDYAQLLTEPR